MESGNENITGEDAVENGGSNMLKAISGGFPRLLVLLTLVALTECSPFPDSVKCKKDNKDCTITNAYGMYNDRTICRAGDAVYPRNEEEILDAVSSASRSKRKMKVATRYSSSVPKLSCPEGDNGLLICTKFLDRILNIDKKDMTMTVESGVRIKELIHAAGDAGLAMPHSTFWWGVTVGGALGTGAHGSSLADNGSALHEYVVNMRIITPDPVHGAIIRQLNSSNPQLLAAKISLGVLGVISQVTFQLMPIFKRSVTILMRSDSDFAYRVKPYGSEHTYSSLIWYPHLREVDYAVDDRVNMSVPGNGKLDYVGFFPLANSISAMNRYNEERIERMNDPDEKCIVSNLTTFSIEALAYGLTNDGVTFTGYPVVGLQNNLMASGKCLDDVENFLITTCPWDPRVNGLFIHQTSISISLSNARDFILDIQKLRDMNIYAFCGSEYYNGIIMRYVKASTAYLGETDDVIKFDMTYYRSKDPMQPRLNEDLFEEIEQIGLYKYNGLPHWGKNRNLAFDGVIEKYKRSHEFLKVRQEFDPDGLFSNDWTDQVLGIKGRTSIFRPGCALEGLCICSQDLHCNPRRGYFCRPGKIYKDARVCSKSS